MWWTGMELFNISIQLILTSIKLLSIIIIHLLNVMMIIFFLFCLVLFELDNVMDRNGIISIKCGWWSIVFACFAADGCCSIYWSLDSSSVSSKASDDCYQVRLNIELDDSTCLDLPWRNNRPAQLLAL